MYYPSSENKGADQLRSAVTAKLICAFVFAYADCWFSHGAAQMFLTERQNVPRCVKTGLFPVQKTKAQINCAVTAVLISTFVFSTYNPSI